MTSVTYDLPLHIQHWKHASPLPAPPPVTPAIPSKANKLLDGAISLELFVLSIYCYPGG